MDKYYTPDLNEFYIGFEYEYQSFSNWAKHKLEDFWLCDNDGCIEDYVPTQSSLSLFRVKLLDKEDIESLGFKLLTTSYGIQYSKDKTLIKFSYDKKLIIEKYFEDFGIVYTVFIGDIKNKSELKKLLKQLGIG